MTGIMTIQESRAWGRCLRENIKRVDELKVKRAENQKMKELLHELKKKAKIQDYE